MAKLAIIIPAYKDIFFEKVLESFAFQTCKDFTIYVGDDNSDGRFLEIIKKYSKIITIHYVKFPNNLGKDDLVAQWTRCIELSQEEEWIWLFSDDDFVDPHCVESFYKSLEVSNSDIYHFNTKIVNDSGKVIFDCRKYPQIIKSEMFHIKKAFGILDSFVVEYIFSRKIYLSVGGFQNFDLAWSSDIATWIKMASHSGIYTIKGGTVFWRCSDYNITPTYNKTIVIRKLKSYIKFIAWVNNYFKSKYIMFINKFAIFKNLMYYSQYISSSDIKYFLVISNKSSLINKLDYYWMNILCILYRKIREN